MDVLADQSDVFIWPIQHPSYGIKAGTMFGTVEIMKQEVKLHLPMLSVCRQLPRDPVTKNCAGDAN